MIRSRRLTPGGVIVHTVEAIKAMKAEKDAEIDTLQKQIDDLTTLVATLVSQSTTAESTYGN